MTREELAEADKQAEANCPAGLMINGNVANCTLKRSTKDYTHPPKHTARVTLEMRDGLPSGVEVEWSYWSVVKPPRIG